MKLFVAAVVLAVFIQSFDCAPLHSSGVSIVTIDGTTVQTTYNNGKAEYTINGKPATEEEAKAALGKANAGNISNEAISMGSVDGKPMTPEELHAFNKKMEEFNKKMQEQMEHMRNQMANAFANMRAPGWPFNQ